eukprot:3691082-Prorocentrum_lima.AAC.1
MVRRAKSSDPMLAQPQAKRMQCGARSNTRARVPGALFLSITSHFNSFFMASTAAAATAGMPLA